MKKVFKIGGLIIIGMMMIFFLMWYKPPRKTLFIDEILNLGHIPLFGLLAVVLTKISKEIFGSDSKSKYFHYGIAAGGAIGIGALTEILQIVGPREADSIDFLRDIVGTAAFLTLLILRDDQIQIKTSMKSAIVISIIVLMVGLLSPLVFLSEAYKFRDRQFPVICNFDHPLFSKFIEAYGGRLHIVQAPPDWRKNSGDLVAHFKTKKNIQYPRFKFIEPYPDWKGYSYLQFTLYSENQDILNMGIGIEDWEHNGKGNDKFRYYFTLKPGLNQCSIPIEEMQTESGARKIDHANIKEITLFVIKPDAPCSLYLDDFILAQEKERTLENEPGRRQ